MNTSTLLAALVMSAFLSPAQSAGAEDMKGMTMKPATSPADKAFAASMNTMMKRHEREADGQAGCRFRAHDDSASSVLG
jgi:hypothetical protein